ncbi:deoxynucleoside kinase [Candidatus Daviesbacteria bacterium]|nr:deoxynucleoside kinase [Candidatus Daviesbacteria bacterium]
MIFALEGLDSSGKTTCGKLLAEQTNGTYFYAANGRLISKLRKYFDNRSTWLRFLFYLIINFGNYFVITKKRRNGNLFLDRTVFSTVAYHKAYGLSEIWFRLIPLFLLNQIDFMVYFTVSEKERSKRIVKKIKTKDTMSKSDEKSLVLGKEIDAEYRKLTNKYTSLIIETDNKTPQQIIDELKLKLSL